VWEPRLGRGRRRLASRGDDEGELDRFIEDVRRGPQGTVGNKRSAAVPAVGARGRQDDLQRLAYMSERFRYKRLEGQAKNTVTAGTEASAEARPRVRPACRRHLGGFLYETCDRGCEFG
jgi:hypothetical protein